MIVRRVFAVLFCSCVAPTLALAECLLENDPLGRADCSSVLFIDGSHADCQTFAGIVASDARSRDEAMNFDTPWCSLGGLNEHFLNHKLNSEDTVYIVDGEYLHFIDYGTPAAVGATYRILVISSGVTITRYPEAPDGYDEVVIRAGSYDSSGPMLNFKGSDITLENLTFEGNIPVPLDPTPGDGVPADTTTQLPGACQTPIDTNLLLYMKRFILFQGSAGARTSGHTLRNIRLDNFEGLNDDGYCYRASKPTGWGIQFQNTDGGIVEDSFISCATTAELEGRSYDPFITADGIQMNYTEGFEVRGNQFSHCGHASLQTRWSSGHVVENNDVTNHIHTGMDLSGDSTDLTVRYNRVHDFDALGIEFNGVSTSLLYNNLIYRGGVAGITLLGVSNGTVTKWSSDNDIFNNLIYDMGRAGIELIHYGSSSPGPSGINDNRIHNNVIFGIQQYAQDPDHAEIKLHFLEPNFSAFVDAIPPRAPGDGNTFDDNVVLGFVDGEAPMTYMEGFELKDEVSLAELNSEAIGSGNLGFATAPDPEQVFVSAAGGDFHWKPGNPLGWPVFPPEGLCLGRDGLPLMTDDYDHDLRPDVATTGVCHVGPYEYAPVPVSALTGWGLGSLTALVMGIGLWRASTRRSRVG